MNEIEAEICQHFGVKPRDGEPTEAATASSETPSGGVAVSATVADELAQAAAHIAEGGGIPPGVVGDLDAICLCGAAESLGLDKALAGQAEEMGFRDLANKLYRTFATMRGVITIGNTPRPPEPNNETELQELLKGEKLP